ncbi:hypothetical protein [Candidatus Hodarchaeum mangrovi]
MDEALPQKHIYLLIGEYKDSLKHLFTKLSNLLIPKILWIDYQIIQLPEFYTLFETQDFSPSHFFFLNVHSEELLNEIIKSGNLQSSKKYNFFTICINMFHYYHILPEIEFYLSKLSETFNILLLTRNKSIQILNSTTIDLIGE